MVELATKSPGAESRRIEWVDEAGGKALAKCDASQMRQVLWNLVRNALQASASGGVVRVACGVSGASVALSVEDDGAGIDDEAKQRIFDAFYTTRAHGAGIGLAVVKRIIDDHAAHGAAITVENGERSGARFRVTFPRSGP